jgi:serine phosphatase RsbU (regulator of sigma subunit)
LNNNHPVIFKNHLNTHHALAPIKKELAKVLDDNFAEAMIVLKEGRKVFGVILLGPKKLGNAFTDYDYTVFQNFYSYFFVCGYYLKNIVKESVVGTVNRELKFSGQIIRSIQENIDQIENPKIDIGYISKSARNLGGEFVDFIRLSDERYIMVFGDLSGKGINASMSMVIIKSIVRTFLAETRDFKVLVQKVNEFIRFNLPKGTFFAGMFALMDFTDNTVYYINCGIPAFFMYNQQYNNVIEIQGEGRVLGFVKSIEKLIRVKKIKLNPGDMLLACSDGLIDSVSMRGEPFGKARVQTTILENLNYPAEKMTNFLYNDLLDFTSKEQEDDVTIVAIKCRSK